MDKQYTEVDSIEIFREILVEPQESFFNAAEKAAMLTTRSTSEYFCLKEGIEGQTFEEMLPWKPESGNTKGRYKLYDTHTLKP